MVPCPCCPLSSSTIMMVTPYNLIFHTALPFPNQIHPSLPHPSLRQWWMAAFTCLSLLHISLPIRLTTQIHTHWLFIPLSFHLPQTPALSFLHFLLILSLSHYWVSFSSSHTPFPPPSCAPFSHFLIFFLPLTVFHAVSLSLHHSFVFCFHIQICPCSPSAFYTSWMTKESRIWREWQEW